MPTKYMSVDEMIATHKSEIRESDGALFKSAAKVPGSWNKEARTATFVMSSEVRDRTGDIISIAGIQTDTFEKNPIALWSHNPGAPIGTWSALEKKMSARPKRLEGAITFAAEGADETADRIARLTDAGVIKACSVGVMVDWNEVEVDFDEAARQYTWRLNRVELVECSPCAVPANQMALAKAVGDDRKFAMETVEQILDAWGKTPAGLIVPRAEAEDAWRALNEHKGATVVVRADGASLSVTNAEDKPDGWFSKVAKALGFAGGGAVEPEVKAEPVVEPEAPKIPKPATAEEKAAVKARAEAVSARVERLLT
jgi:HK97 family phage prohead protease